MSANGAPGSLVVEGELDLATVARLDRIDPSAMAGDLILDCRLLSFMDATGARAMLALADRIGPNRRLILKGTYGIVARVIEVLRLDSRAGLDIVPGVTAG